MPRNRWTALGVVLAALASPGLAFAGAADAQPQAEARKHFSRVAELMGKEGLNATSRPDVKAEVQGILTSLEKLGSSALDVYRERLAHGSFWEKSLALRMLANLREGAKPAVPEIREATREPEDEGIKRGAVVLLARLDQSDATVQRLAEALQDKDLGSDVADALGEIGPRASAAVPALVQAGKDPTRWSAAWVVALGKIHSNPDLSVPALIEAMETYSIHAPVALASFGRRARPGVPQLLRVLQEALKGNLQDQGPMIRALQVRDGVEAALAAAYGVEKGSNVLMTFEQVMAVIEPEHKDTLKQIAEKLKAADLVDTVLETRPLESPE